MPLLQLLPPEVLALLVAHVDDARYLARLALSCRALAESARHHAHQVLKRDIAPYDQNEAGNGVASSDLSILRIRQAVAPWLSSASLQHRVTSHDEYVLVAFRLCSYNHPEPCAQVVNGRLMPFPGCKGGYTYHNVLVRAHRTEMIAVVYERLRASLEWPLEGDAGWTGDFSETVASARPPPAASVEFFNDLTPGHMPIPPETPVYSRLCGFPCQRSKDDYKEEGNDSTALRHSRTVHAPDAWRCSHIRVNASDDVLQSCRDAYYNVMIKMYRHHMRRHAGISLAFEAVGAALDVTLAPAGTDIVLTAASAAVLFYIARHGLQYHDSMMASVQSQIPDSEYQGRKDRHPRLLPSQPCLRLERATAILLGLGSCKETPGFLVADGYGPRSLAIFRHIEDLANEALDSALHSSPTDLQLTALMTPLFLAALYSAEPLWPPEAGPTNEGHSGAGGTSCQGSSGERELKPRRLSLQEDLKQRHLKHDDSKEPPQIAALRQRAERVLLTVLLSHNPQGRSAFDPDLIVPELLRFALRNSVFYRFVPPDVSVHSRSFHFPRVGAAVYSTLKRRRSRGGDSAIGAELIM